MSQIAKITDPQHDKYEFWFLVVREGNSQVAGNVLNGQGTADPEGILINKSSLGPRFNCPDTKLDRTHNAFMSFPVRVYGTVNQHNPSGEYEIVSGRANAVTARPVSAIKPGASWAGSQRGGSGSQTSTKGASSILSSTSSGTAILDAPAVSSLVPISIVKPVVKPKPVVKTVKRVSPSAVALSGSPQDGAPVVQVNRIAAFLDLLDVKQAVMIWGPAGVGKSEAIQDWAHERNKRIYDWRLAMMDPSVIQGVGVPDFHEQRTKFFPLDTIPTGPNCVLFLDEITTAPPTIQALAYQITLNRMIGSTPLPEDCVVICAGNRMTDRGVAYQMPSPLANRLFHLTVKEDISSWRNWAVTRGVDPRIISFLSLRPEYLHKMDPKTSGEAWPSPRSWAACNRVLNSDLNPMDQGVGIASLVGTAAAREFIKHCEGYDKSVRRIDDIMNGLAKDYIETDPSRAQTVVVALVANTTNDPEILENVIAWLRNPKLNDEYRNLGIRGLEERFGEDVLQTIPSYTGVAFEKGDDDDGILPF